MDTAAVIDTSSELWLQAQLPAQLVGKVLVGDRIDLPDGDALPLPFPLFVKPVKATFSVLARRVDSFAELRRHLRFGWFERLVAEAEKAGLPKARVDGLFQLMRNQGTIYEARPGLWKLTRF